MKIVYPILFFLLVFANVKAQSLHINSTKFVSGSIHSDINIYYAISTKDKGILFTGTTDCTGGGDIPSNPPDTIASSPGGNLIIGKIDSNNNLNWVKVYGGSWYDAGWAACQAADSGFAILGNTWSNDRDVSGNHAIGIGDLWLVRIDKDGNLLWQKCFGSGGDEEPISIALAQDNGFILLGESNSAGGDVPSHYGSVFTEDWFVVRTDSLGDKLWSKTFGGTGNEGNGSVLSINNAFYIVSTSSSRDYDCNDTSWHSSSTNTLNDVYLVKLDASGNLALRKSFGSSNNDEASNAIWDERDNSIVIAGGTNGNDYMISGNHGSDDMLVIKVDTGGNLKWTKCLGDITQEGAASIVGGPGNGYIIYGNTFGGTHAIPADIGGRDAWVFLTDSFGNVKADKIFGGIKDERPFSILPFKEGYAAIGLTFSKTFTEGTNYGDTTDTTYHTNGFISYIKLWALEVPSQSLRERELIVYPNPNEGEMKIIFPSYEKGELTICDINGKIVYKEKINKQKTFEEIDTSDWIKGVYLIKWISESGIVKTKKLINN